MSRLSRLLFLCLCLFGVTSTALADFMVLTVNGTDITDNSNFDLDPANDVIELDSFVPGTAPGLEVTGTLRLELDNFGARLVFTDALITNTGNSAVLVEVQTFARFPKIELPTDDDLVLQTGVHLVGLMGPQSGLGPAITSGLPEDETGEAEDVPLGHSLGSTPVTFSGLANLRLLNTVPIPIRAHTLTEGILLSDILGPDTPPGSEDVLVFFGDDIVSKPGVPISSLAGTMTIALEPGDAVFLPASASISAAVVTIPEPSSIVLIVIALVSRLAHGRRHRA